MKRITLLSIIGALLITSCDKVALGEDEPNDTENNFELLWNDFDQHYSLFEVRGTDWQALYGTYRPQVTETTTDAQLWETLTDLLENLDDSHTVLYNADRSTIFRSGHTLNEQSESEISQEVLSDSYIENRIRVTSEVELSYGNIKGKNIGYIYLGSMNGQNPSIINTITKELENSQALILDIRQNTGGEDRYGARIAGAFSDEINLIYTVQTRNGPNYDDFDSKKEYYTAPDGSEPYLKPVIILTDRKTISAGETFLLHMKSFEHVVQVGDTTAGDFSTVSNRRFLPNGWSYQYSIQKFMLPDGTSLDGIGHVPDVYVKNTASDIAKGQDKVMERALDYLFEEFGIE